MATNKQGKVTVTPMRKQRRMSDKPAKRGPGRPRVEGREPKKGNPIYALRLDATDTAWVKSQGGPEYVRRLIHEDRDRQAEST